MAVDLGEVANLIPQALWYHLQFLRLVLDHRSDPSHAQAPPHLLDLLQAPAIHLYPRPPLLVLMAEFHLAAGKPGKAVDGIVPVLHDTGGDGTGVAGSWHPYQSC